MPPLSSESSSEELSEYTSEDSGIDSESEKIFEQLSKDYVNLCIEFICNLNVKIATAPTSMTVILPTKLNS